MQDIEKVVIQAYREQFPGAPTEEIQDLIRDIGQTVFIEGMAEIVEEIEKKDKEVGMSIKSLLDDEKNVDVVPHIAKACATLKIDIEKILNRIAKDVVKEVLSN